MKISKFVVCSLFVSACSSHEPSQKGRAHLMSQGPVTGNVSFEQTKQGIKVLATIEGLAPQSVHGMHVHETGKCEGPDYKSAGDHFNPEHSHHGGPEAKTKHPGDFGNVVADAKGKAFLNLLLRPDEVAGLKMFVGKAVILHAKADDLVSQPSGNAGDRIACGLILE